MNPEKYTAFFCEENIWQLLNSIDHLEFKKYSILFITNEYKTCALMNQRAAREGEYIIWDYHVILHDLDKSKVLDYDTLLGFETNIEEYFTHTFGNQKLLPPQYQSQLIEIQAEEYYSKFNSDRSHMLDSLGNQVQKFPDWPPVINKDGINLKDLMNMTESVKDRFNIYSKEEYLKKF